MDTLTLHDISPEAIDAQQKILIQCDAELEQLAAQMAEVEARRAALLERRNQIQRDLVWRHLMAEVEVPSSRAAAVVDALEEAGRVFTQSLMTPDDYIAEVGDDGSKIAYSDTDDYADFSVVERCVEGILDEVRVALKTASTPQKMISESRGDKTTASASEDASRAQSRRAAMLQLLVLSIYTGRVEKLCHFDKIHRVGNVPMQTAEELREEVSELWKWALDQPNVLTVEERLEWKEVLLVYLGQAFVSPE